MKKMIRSLSHYKSIVIYLLGVLLILPSTPLRAMEDPNERRNNNNLYYNATFLTTMAAIFQTYSSLTQYTSSGDCYSRAASPQCPSQQQFLIMNGISLVFNIGLWMALLNIIKHQMRR